MAQKAIAAAQDATAYLGGGAGGGVVGFRLKDGTGAFNGTIIFEALIEGVAVPIEAFPFAGGASVASATANGNFRVKAHGTEGVRARCTVLAAADGMTIFTVVSSDGSI